MRKTVVLLILLLLLAVLPHAAAEEYFALRPGFASSLSEIGIGFYPAPSFQSEPTLRIGAGVTLYLEEITEDGWAHVRFLCGDAIAEGYVRTGSLVMNDYGLAHDTVRLVSGQAAQTVPLRKEPSADATVYGHYYTGTLFKCYQVRPDGYARVAVGETVGYIPSAQLVPYDSCTTSALPKVTLSTPAGGEAALRQVAFPSVTSPLAQEAAYPNGTDAVVLGILPDGSCHIMIDGRTGYMDSAALQPLLPAVQE